MKFTSRMPIALGAALVCAAAISSAQAQDYPLQRVFDARAVTATHPLNRAAVTLTVVDSVVYFNSNSHKLTPQGEKQVAKIAAILKDRSFRDCHLTVKGYTDGKGSDAHNKKLSYERAVTVMHALVTKYGIPAEKLSAEGMGKANPVATNSTAAGRAMNRRVIVVNGGM